MQNILPPTLTDIKERLALEFRTSGRAFGHGSESHSFSLLPPEFASRGLPKGGLVEICGSPGGGKTQTLARFMAEHPALKVAWVESELTAYPLAFWNQGVGLDRILFVECSPTSGSNSRNSSRNASGTQLLWVCHQILASQVFGVLVCGLQTELVASDLELRRLQLAAEKSGVCVIFLKEYVRVGQSHGTWPISVQLEVSREGADGIPKITVLRHRGRACQLSKSSAF
ncbi:hypothetical protein WDW86_17695 [Bdellovibrionota bacterium FG-2]